jgi:hypothetical protein
MMNQIKFIIVHEFIIIELGLCMVRQKHNLLYIERTCFNIINSCRVMCIALIIHDVSTGYNVAMQFYGDMSYGEMYIIIIGL